MNPPRDHLVGAALAPISPETTPGIDHRVLARLVNAHTELLCPGISAACGITEEDLDTPPKSLAEAAKAGWISAGEKRQIEGVATEEDLMEAGYSPDEVREILAEQERACVSSS